MSKVKAYNEKKTIKTYLIGDPDINPFISEDPGKSNVLPLSLEE